MSDEFIEYVMDIIAMQAARLIDSGEAHRRILNLCFKDIKPTYSFPQDITSNLAVQILR